MKLAVAPFTVALAQASRLPSGPAKHCARVRPTGPVTLAVAVAIGTVHSVPMAFQYSSSWSSKWFSAPRAV